LATAAKARPNWPEPWLYTGLAAYGNGDQKTSEEDLRKAIEFTANDSRGNYQIRRAYYTLGRLLTDQNRKEEAAAFVSRFREIQAEMLLEIQRTHGTMGGGMAQMTPSASAFSALATTETEVSFLLPLIGNQAFPFDIVISRADAPTIDRESTNAQEAELRKLLAGALNDLGTVEARQEQFAMALSHFQEAEKWNSETPVYCAISEWLPHASPTTRRRLEHCGQWWQPVQVITSLGPC
jgi:tetratricopeptide (TPR) repeat protein